MTRNALLWPFSPQSIWNMPVGSDAVRVAAKLPPVTTTIAADKSIVLMDPTAPLTKITQNAGFSSHRCVGRATLANVPMAPSFVVASSGHNYETGAVEADGKTYVQGTAFARCTAGKPATLAGCLATQSIYGDGLIGYKGGSHLSTLGGTIRVGEFTSGVIPHALALDFDFLQISANAFRWPATKKDTYAYKGKSTKLVPGVLVALPADFVLGSMQSLPGRIVATALMHHGGYGTNDTKSSAFHICTELGPAGDVTEEFQSLYGEPFQSSGTSAWKRDVAHIYSLLDIIDNNSPTSIGGGGTPVVPLAPPLS